MIKKDNGMCVGVLACGLISFGLLSTIFANGDPRNNSCTVTPKCRIKLYLNSTHYDCRFKFCAGGHNNSTSGTVNSHIQFHSSYNGGIGHRWFWATCNSIVEANPFGTAKYVSFKLPGTDGDEVTIYCVGELGDNNEEIKSEPALPGA